jgi:hypothetical protein
MSNSVNLTDTNRINFTSLNAKHVKIPPREVVESIDVWIYSVCLPKIFQIFRISTVLNLIAWIIKMMGEI